MAATGLRSFNHKRYSVWVYFTLDHLSFGASEIIHVLRSWLCKTQSACIPYVAQTGFPIERTSMVCVDHTFGLRIRSSRKSAGLQTRRRTAYSAQHLMLPLRATVHITGEATPDPNGQRMSLRSVLHCFIQVQSCLISTRQVNWSDVLIDVILSRISAWHPDIPC